MDTPDCEDILCEDIESLLINHDEMQLYFKKLKDSCANFDNKFERNILVSIAKNSECAKQVEESSRTIAELMNEKKELKTSLDNIRLEQKLVEKRAINTMKDIEKTKADIESIKAKNEKLALEIVDFQQESEKQRDYLKTQWYAVKKAFKMYKNILDVHIDVENKDHVEHVTVTFFWAENPTDQKFFVILTNQNSCWRVKKIEPELSMENKYQLNHIVQFSKQAEVSNVTLLLCKLREFFLDNYFKNIHRK